MNWDRMSGWAFGVLLIVCILFALGLAEICFRLKQRFMGKKPRLTLAQGLAIEERARLEYLEAYYRMNYKTWANLAKMIDDYTQADIEKKKAEALTAMDNEIVKSISAGAVDSADMLARTRKFSELDPGAYVWLRGPVDQDGNSIWERQSDLYEHMKSVVEAAGFESITECVSVMPTQVPGWFHVLEELRSAVDKFPTWPTHALHAVGVLNEEVGELNKAILQEVYEPSKNLNGDVRREAIQAAAMALRFVISLDHYDYSSGVQHTQFGSSWQARK